MASFFRVVSSQRGKRSKSVAYSARLKQRRRALCRRWLGHASLSALDAASAVSHCRYPQFGRLRGVERTPTTSGRMKTAYGSKAAAITRVDPWSRMRRSQHYPYLRRSPSSAHLPRPPPPLPAPAFLQLLDFAATVLVAVSSFTVLKSTLIFLSSESFVWSKRLLILFRPSSGLFYQTSQ